MEDQQALRGRFEYSIDVFEPVMMERMVGHFENLLSGIVANLEQSIWELSLLSARE